MRVLFLNGPPSSGKDYLSGLIASRYEGAVLQEKIAEPLKAMAHRIYQTMLGWRWDHFDAKNPAGVPIKDVPFPPFHGKTPREVYQAVSELYVKPFHGKKFFGERFVERLERLKIDPPHGTNLVAVSDCGFPEEVAPLLDSDMTEHVDVLRIRREGKTFEGDTRKYLDRMSVQAELQNPSKIRRVIFHDFTNDGTDDENWNKLCEVLPWLG
jgi:hypothetical protein